MGRITRCQFGFCCCILSVVLVCSMFGSTFGQTAEAPRHAVYVEHSDARQPVIAPPATRRADRAPASVPPYYGYSYGYSYGWPYSAGAQVGYPYGATYRLRQWGPYGRPFAVPGRPFRGLWIDDDDRQYRRWHLVRRTRARTRRLLETHDVMMSRGLAAFAQGRYETARSAFVLAAGMNKYEAASRIHAAHSCLAMGKYSRAVRWLQEAFSLEPRLRELPYDVRDDYGRQEDFEQHLAALKACVSVLANDADPLIVLGYVLYYTGQRGEAYEALTKARARVAKDEPKGDLVGMLLENCEPGRYASKKPGG